MDAPISTKAALIQALAVAPGYGSSLIERVAESTGLELHQGSVYPMLLTLEEEGYVKRKKVASAGRALHYELTKKGERLAIEHREVVAKVFRLSMTLAEEGKA